MATQIDVGVVVPEEPDVLATTDRDTQYDPVYTPPVVDPEAQKGLTDMLSRFGIEYPNAPRATPQLLAFMNGLGMSMDTFEDVARQKRLRVEGRSADSLQDIQRGDQRKRQNIADSQQARNVLSSGATNTKFARQAEDRVAAESDVARRKADDIGEISETQAIQQDQLRQGAVGRVIDEETKQETADALSKEQVRAFNQQQTVYDKMEADQQAARDAYTEQQKELYATLGLGVQP